MGGVSPCASCKLLRRRCTKDCIFAPFFPPDDPNRFAIVHKVFGASNVSKMLQMAVPPKDAHVSLWRRLDNLELPVEHRVDAVSSLVYEANARFRDPVYGCVGVISCLQKQVSQLEMQLAMAQAEILGIQMQQESPLLDHQIDEDGRSIFLYNNLTDLPQFTNFTSSSNVIQGQLKRVHEDMT